MDIRSDTIEIRSGSGRMPAWRVAPDAPGRTPRSSC
jgi:hypothetical protein